MAEAPQKTTQIFIKLLNNKTLTLQFPPQTQITHQLITSQIPNFNFNVQTLTLNGKLLSQTTQPLKIPDLSTLILNLPFNGGKGGFGSLLRGAATKAGQKKTNNFDACRDMSGRRLRHVNAEKKMEEWKLEEDERKLEKKAEKYLKELAMKGKGGKRDDGAEKYVEKYREVSKRCVEDVDNSVREAAKLGFGGRKRKGGDGDSVDAKKLKIWMGKRKMGESDNDDSDEDTDSDAENEKSAVTDNGSQSDSSKDACNNSVSASQLSGDRNGSGSSDSASEEEKEILASSIVKTDATLIGSNSQSNSDGHMETLSDGEAKMCKPCGSAEVASIPAHVVSEKLENKSAPVEVDGTQPEPVDLDVHGDSECKTASPEEDVIRSSMVSEAQQPLIFDDFGSAAELEVLGMERLKCELQERGLKCGGTLQERAARLFLLKTTPLEKLPKKLLAKK